MGERHQDKEVGEGNQTAIGESVDVRTGTARSTWILPHLLLPTLSISLTQPLAFCVPVISIADTIMLTKRTQHFVPT